VGTLLEEPVFGKDVDTGTMLRDAEDDFLEHFGIAATEGNREPNLILHRLDPGAQGDALLQLGILPHVLSNGLAEVPAVEAVLDDEKVGGLPLLIYILHEALQRAGPVGRHNTDGDLLVVEPDKESLHGKGLHLGGVFAHLLLRAEEVYDQIAFRLHDTETRHFFQIFLCKFPSFFIYFF